METQTKGQTRNNTQKGVTMPEELWEKIDRWAEAWLTTRSAALQRIILELPEPKKAKAR